MVGSRTLRSSKSLDTATAVPVSIGQTSKETSPSIISKTEGTHKRRGPPNVKPIPIPSKTSSKPHTSDKNANEDDEVTDNDSDEDDDDKADVRAPSSDFSVPMNSVEDSPTSNVSARELKQSEHKSWTGLKKKGAANGVPTTDGDNHFLHKAKDPMKIENNISAAVSVTDLSDESSETEESDFEVPEDDDDYDAVDNISIASDDSRAFEADVEREIQAAGVDGIDWDDQNTYGFDESVNRDIFGSSLGNHPVYELDIFAFERDLDARLTQTASNIQDTSPLMGQIDQTTSENMLKMERSWASDSDSSSAVAEAPIVLQPKSEPKRKPALRMETSFDEEHGDTTDEDIPQTTVSSPGVTLSRSNSNMGRKHPKSKKLPRTSQTRYPMRRIPRHPTKAMAYSVNKSYGTRVQYIKVPGRSYRWINPWGRSSRNSSGASSPTMINVADALAGGNTRSGAHITDIINGSFFSRRHCQTLSTAAALETETHSPLSKFYQPLLKNGPEDHDNTQHDFANKLLEDSALALIDFEGGANEGPPSEDLPMQALLSSSPQESAYRNSNSDLRVPITPPPEHDVGPEDEVSSPKKRRIDRNFSGLRSVSPALKKQRRDHAHEVLGPN